MRELERRAGFVEALALSLRADAASDWRDRLSVGPVVHGRRSWPARAGGGGGADTTQRRGGQLQRSWFDGFLYWCLVTGATKQVAVFAAHCVVRGETGNDENERDQGSQLFRHFELVRMDRR